MKSYVGLFTLESMYNRGRLVTKFPHGGSKCILQPAVHSPTQKNKIKWIATMFN